MVCTRQEKMVVMKQSWVILVVLSLAGALQAADPPPLVINEFMARNDATVQDVGGDYDDWIEIHNLGGQSVDMGGMYLTDRLSNPTKWRVPIDVPTQTTIAPHGYLLIWADDEPEQGVLHAGFKLSDTGEAIGLYDVNGTPIDSVTFGPQNPDRSQGRFPDGAADWQSFTTPTPGRPNEQDHPDVVINEIMYHAYSEALGAEDPGAEYIELFNRGSSAVSLDGWRLTRGVQLDFPDVVIGPGAYLVVAADLNAFALKYPDVHDVVGGWNGRLSNAGETVELSDGAVVVDSVRYADDGDWSVRELGPVDHRHRGWIWRSDHDGSGKSLELINGALPNEYGSNWAASDPDGGTPGTVNSVAAGDVAPLIANVSHGPVVPGPVDPVVVTAVVADESSDGPHVTLHYRVDRSEYIDPNGYPIFDANDYTVLSMFDDGAHGDGWALDGVYGAEIPPHPDETVIEFYVEASDAAGRSRTWPAPSFVDGRFEQVTNALYRVDATFNPYAYWQIGSQPLYYMVMTEMERGRLAYLGSRSHDAFSSARMNGTFISVDGQDILVNYNVGIRNRGNGSRTPPPNNYRVDFSHDRLWKGVPAINVNSKYTYNQVLGHAVFHMAGLPALNAKGVPVRVNGEDLSPRDPGRMYGSYAHLEVYDSDWVDNHFPDDNRGNLYRCVSRSRFCDLRYRGDAPAVYGGQDRYAKKTNSAVNDWSDLIELTYTLDESPDETYVQDLEKVIDVDQWLRWFALEALLTNRETNLSNGYGDDYCMYRGADDPRFILLPYDLDSVLNSPNPNTSIWLAGRLNNLPVIRRFLTHPEFVSGYYAQLKDLAETVFSPEKFNPLVDHVLGGWVPEQRLDAIKDFAAARRQYVLSVIPQTFSVGSELRSGEGYHLKTIPYAYENDVRGTADATQTRSVLINGHSAEWSARQGEWVLGSTMLDLFPGINRIFAEAFDGPDGAGRRLSRGYTDIFYNTGFTNNYPQDAPPGNTVSSLSLIVRDSYLPGVPVLVRVEILKPDGSVDRDIWDATATLSVSDNEEIDLSTRSCTLYNGLGSALVTIAGSGDFTLTVRAGGAEAHAFLVDLNDQPVNVVAGTLTGSQRWGGVYRITGGDFTIPAGVELTLEPGTLVLVDGVPSGRDGTDIDVRGSIQSLGTAAAPVTITALTAGENWGELHHVDAAPSSFYYTNITQAGHSPPVGHSHSGPVFRTSDSTLLFDHVSLTDHAGKIMDADSGTDLTFRRSLFARSVMGPEIAGTALQFEDSWITQMRAADDADGIYIHDQLASQQCRLIGGVVAGIDDDGIDTLGSEVLIEDVIVRDCKDKAISVYGGQTTISHCLVVGNNTAPEDPTVASVVAKAFEGSQAVVNIDHTTVVTTKTPGHVDVGLQSHNKYGVAAGTIVFNVTNSIIDATDPAEAQAPYRESDIHISYSNLVGETWPGSGNVNADAAFANLLQNDYRLGPDSPCIGAASPTGDMGYYPYEEVISTESPSLVFGGDMIWTAEDGPYRIMADLTVESDMTLTIGPGTTVFFDPNATMIVRGQLQAEGTEYAQIRFTRTPELGGAWGGIQFLETTQDNRISHAVIEHGRTNDGMVGLEDSRLLLDHVTLDHTDLRRIRTIDSSLVVRNSHFTDIFEPGEPPTTDNLSEHIWGSGVPENGWFVIENNVFGTTTGYNDAIDFDGPTRPAAIPQILNNVFMGGGDDALDLETDAHIEGNVFMHYLKDAFNNTPRESNVISAGRGRDYVVVRNVFYHIGHVAQIKNRAFMQFENNTVVDAGASVFYFEIPGQTTSPGRGVWMDSCVFWNCPTLLESFYVDDAEWGTTDIVVNRCLVPTEWHALGAGNIDADPLFAGPEDFRLKPASAARGAGAGGLDMGAHVPVGASVSGVPSGWTHRRDATLTVWGPGITHYKYSLNSPNGPWSQEYSTDAPIVLTGLRDGDLHTVYVQGKNSAGVWQEQPNASATWAVDTTYRQLWLNEVLANNQAVYEHEGTFPDALELYYEGPSAINLSGMSLTDDPHEPTKFVFPAGVSMNPGDYLILWADSEVATSGLHLGFGFDTQGDQVYLYDRNGGLLDSVAFGHQLPDKSIARVGPDADWRLAVPTLGQANIALPLGEPVAVRINEWLAGAQVLFVHDFVELYNPGAWPVDMGAFHLTDNPTTQPDKHEIRPLSFVEGQGFTVFQANDEGTPGHVGFGLSTDGEMIGLLDPNQQAVDRIVYGSQTPDVSQGRAPDGSNWLEWSALPTPGSANPVVLQPVITRTVLVAENADKRATIPLSEDQVDEGWESDPAFDDSTWLDVAGALGGVGYERSSGYQNMIGLDVEMQMYGFNTTCYVRIPFYIEGALLGNVDELLLSLRYDDGFVVYLNGVEIARANISGAPQWDSQAESSHEAGSDAFDVVLDITAYTDLLHEGEDLLAIHALNRSLTSSDFLISAMLEATAVEFIGGEHPHLKELQLLDGLRVTELMYHSENGDNGDYVELQNVGAVPLDLTGLRFTEGIQFTFPPMILEAGEYTVVAGDAADFQAAYGSGIPLAGVYADRLSDRGEDVVLKLAAPWDAALMRFRYADHWYSATDGDGQSLNIREVTAAPVTWNDRENWRASPPTPGRP